MVSCVLQVLLLSAVFGAVFCDSPEVQVVKNLIATSNELVRDHNLTEIELPNIGWAFDPTLYKGGRLAQFDTLELLPDPEVVKVTNSTGTFFIFNVTATLKELNMKLKFVVIPPYTGKSGNVTITVCNDSFRLEGHVLVKRNGTCSAILKDNKVVKLGDSKVKYQPDEEFIYNIYEDVDNFVRYYMESVINLTVRTEVRKPFSKKKFSELTCAEVKRILMKKKTRK